MSEQAGKQISAVERASEASRLEQVDEWGERMSKVDEQMARYLHLNS